MKIIATVGSALRQLFGKTAEEKVKESGVIIRERVFTGESLAKTFVLGFLQKPNASDEDLAQMAAQCGAPVTPQAIEQRHTQKLVNFLQGMFCDSVKSVVGSDKALAPILERFPSVTLLDSSTIALSDGMEEQFRGCGGSHEGGKAALKLQTELDLRTGALDVQVEAGRSTDNATSRQHVRRGPGSLRITDLGYFSGEVFKEMTAAGEYFLSRLQFGTKVLLPSGAPIADLFSWLGTLAKQSGPFVDQPILLANEHRLSCRLIAWRLPEEQANRRRQKLRKEMLSKNGKEPSAERLEWCDWTILVTSVPVEMMSPAEAVVLYRARWQVELLFKRWKSQGLVAQLSGSTVVRQMVRLWSRLLAAVVQHWLLVASVWGDATKSLSKACEAIRRFVGRLTAALDRQEELERVLADICEVIAKTCQRNKRSKPGTFELLNDVELLDFDFN